MKYNDDPSDNSFPVTLATAATRLSCQNGLRVPKGVLITSIIDTGIHQSEFRRLMKQHSLRRRQSKSFACKDSMPLRVGRMLRLAERCAGLGRFTRAESLLKQAQKAVDQELGSNHPCVADILTHIARVYRKQGRLVETEGLYHQALVVLESSYGPAHQTIAKTLSEAATLYIDTGESEKAESLLYMSITIQELSGGSESVELATPLIHLGKLYKATLEYEKAQIPLNRAMHVLRKHYGAVSNKCVVALEELASLCELQQDYPRAECLYQELADLLQRSCGVKCPETLQSLRTLTGIYLKNGKQEEASTLAKSCISLCDKLFGKNHAETVKARAMYGAILYQQQEYEFAIHQLELASLSIEQCSESDQRFLADIYDLMADACEKMGHGAEVERHRLRSREARKQSFSVH